MYTQGIQVPKLNKVDEEILQILKKTFLSRHIDPLASDRNMRIWIIRILFLLSFVGLIFRILFDFTDKVISAEMPASLTTPIALFFGILFLHIHNESKNTSILIFVLTWVSIIIGLYV